MNGNGNFIVQQKVAQQNSSWHLGEIGGDESSLMYVNLYTFIL